MIFADGIFQIFNHNFVKPTTNDIFLSFRQFYILFQVARHFRCAFSTIRLLWAKFQRNGSIHGYLHQPLRCRITSHHQDHHIFISHLRDRFTTATSTARRSLGRINHRRLTLLFSILVYPLGTKGKDGHSTAAQNCLGDSYRYYSAYRHVCICLE